MFQVVVEKACERKKKVFGGWMSDEDAFNTFVMPKIPLASRDVAWMAWVEALKHERANLMAFVNRSQGETRVTTYYNPPSKK